MRHSLHEIPEEIREDYLRHETVLFRSRAGLYCLVATTIYFCVSLQYLFRKTVLQMDTFRSWELSLWAILIVGTVICHGINLRTRTRSASKTAALLYTGFFVWSLSGLAVVYPENILVFAFYYAFALLLTSILIPWRMSEVFWLTAYYSLGFLAAFDYVAFVTTAGVRNQYGGPMSKKVLVIDDDAATLKLLQAFLSAKDLEVHTAEDGIDALERIKK